MKVGSTDEAGRAHVTYPGPGVQLDTRSDPIYQTGKMRLAGQDPPAMINVDCPTIAPHGSSKQDCSCACHADRCPGRCRVVDPRMYSLRAKHRMSALTED